MVALPDNPMPTIDKIYAWYAEKNNKPYNTPRIGAAAAAVECDRAVYYSFRWVSPPKQFEGRMQRLFGTGHLQESRLTTDLRNAGITVIDRNEETGKQWELTDKTGHVVCRMDAAIVGLLEAPLTWHVGEFKTHNDKSFKAIEKEGVKEAKPEHYGQCQLGMHFSGMERAYYLAHNKDNDKLYSERIPYDSEYSIRLEVRLHRIALSEVVPSRLSENPTFFKCKFCDHHNACHQGFLPQRNCRTCLHATALDHDALWHCRVHYFHPDRDKQRDGCASQRYIPELVLGNQIDARGEGEALVIVYRMKNGAIFEDFGPERKNAEAA